MPEKSNIAELPAELGSGGGGFHLPHRPIAELPPVTGLFGREAVDELFRLRDRVHALESQHLASKLKINFPPTKSELPPAPEALFRYAPNELPEGGEGGGGVYHPIHEIAELPPFEFGNIAQYLSAVVQRISAVEASLAALHAKVNAGG